MNFGTTYPQAWPRPQVQPTPWNSLPPVAPQPWQIAPTQQMQNTFNWPQPQLAMPQGGGGFNIAELVKALNAPSQLEQQHNDWVASGAPSYLGGKQNPFNSGFFGNNTGVQQAANQNVGFATNTNINSPAVTQAGAILASPAPVGIPQAGNQTGNPIDYNAIAALRQSAQRASPFGQWR